jgi:hypothetical protein
MNFTGGHHGNNNNYDNDDGEHIEEKISLDELYDRKRAVELHRLGIYKKILNRVHTKIKMVARQKINNDYLFYIVPEVIFGFPKYNLNECIAYLIEKLQENGFNVKYTHPNLLFISWNHYIPSYEREKIKQMTGKVVDGFGNIIKDTNKDKGKNKDKFGSVGSNNIFDMNSSNNQSHNVLPHKLSSTPRNPIQYNLKYNPSISLSLTDYGDNIDYNNEDYYDNDGGDYGNDNDDNSKSRQSSSSSKTKTVHFRDISSYKPSGIYNKELVKIIHDKLKNNN